MSELIKKQEIIDTLNEIEDSIKNFKDYNTNMEEKLIDLSKFETYIENNNLDIEIDSLFNNINQDYIEFIDEIINELNILCEKLNESLESDISTRVGDDRIDFILERIEEVLEILQKYDYDTCDIVSDEDIKEIQQLINESLAYDKLKKKESNAIYRKRQREKRKNEK